MEKLTKEQVYLVKKIVQEYINYNLSHKDPLITELIKIMELIEGY